MEIPTPRFLLGDRVWTASGQSGLVALSSFNADAGEWLYALDGVAGTWRESQLLDVSPEQLEEQLAETLPPLPAVAVEFEEIEDAVRALGERVEQLTQAFGALPFPLDPEAVQGIAEAASRAAVEPLALDLASLRSEALAIHSAQSDVFQELESAITTGLSQIGNRLDTLESNAVSATGLNLVQLFLALGGLIRNPLAFILDRSAQQIIEGIQDGIDIGLSNDRN